jgi:hypothetical protein
MNSMSLKEKAILAIFVVVLLYLAVAGLWFFRQQGEWRRSVKAYEKAKRTYLREKNSIRQRNQWEEKYEEAKSAMPSFTAVQNTDTPWRRKIDDLAEKCNISIANRGTDEQEICKGDIYEMPISIRGFQGSLEAIVTFMYELESGRNGIFAVKEISVSPINKSKVFSGYLRGDMLITCAYMRDAEGADPNKKGNTKDEE